MRNLKVVSNNKNPMSNIDIVTEIVKDYEGIQERVNENRPFLCIKRVVQPEDKSDFKWYKKVVEDELNQSLRKYNGSNEILKTRQNIHLKTHTDDEFEMVETIKTMREELSDEFREKGNLPYDLMDEICTQRVEYQDLEFNSPYKTTGEFFKITPSSFDVFKFDIQRQHYSHMSSYDSLIETLFSFPFDLENPRRSVYIDEDILKMRTLFECLECMFDYDYMSETFSGCNPHSTNKMNDDEVKSFYETINKLDKNFLLEKYSEFKSHIKWVHEKLDNYYSHTSMDFSKFLEIFPNIKPLVEKKIKQIKDEELRKSKLQRKKVKLEITMDLELELDCLDDKEMKEKIITNIKDFKMRNGDIINDFHPKDYLKITKGSKFKSLEIIETEPVNEEVVN